MTVFAIFTYTEFFKHKSAEGEKMDKKTTGIIAYITWIGLIVAFCAGDKEGAKFHLNQALVITLGWIIAGVVSVIPVIGTIVGGILYIFMTVCSIMGLIYACQEQEKEVPLIGQIKIIIYQKKEQKNPRCISIGDFLVLTYYSAVVEAASAVSSAVVRFTFSGCSPCRNVIMI